MRTVRMFVLSPLVTAASASACERAGLLEVVAVEARAHDARAVPVLEAPEGLGRLVDDGHGVALGAEGDGEARADAATPDDDDVHATVQHAASGRAKSRARERSAVSFYCVAVATPTTRPGRRSPCPAVAARGHPRDPPLPAEEQAARAAAGHRAAGDGAAEPAHRPRRAGARTASRPRPTAPRRC